MSDFDSINIRKLDGALLLIFLGLMRHRKASAVAEEIGLTQSAVSHAIGRLRDAFGDDLFLRQPHGMEPTAVALALEPKIRTAVEALQAALRPPAFDPARHQGTLRVAALDYETAVVLPGLASALSKSAPGLRLSVRDDGRAEAMAGLMDGRLDLALGFFWDLPAPLIWEPLAQDGYLMVAQAGHPALSGGLAAYLAARHLIVAPEGDMTGIVDRALEREGHPPRTVALTVPRFLPAFAVLGASDLVAVLPARLARAQAARHGLAVADPPIALRAFTTGLVRHRRDAASGLHDFVTRTARAVVLS